jgi:hypothetical protein
MLLLMRRSYGCSGISTYFTVFPVKLHDLQNVRKVTLSDLHDTQ